MKWKLSALSLLLIIVVGAIDIYHAKKRADAVDAMLQNETKTRDLIGRAAAMDMRALSASQFALYVGMAKEDFLTTETGQQNDTQIISQSGNSTVYAVNRMQPSATFVTIFDGRVSAIDHHPTTSMSTPNDTHISRPTTGGL